MLSFFMKKELLEFIRKNGLSPFNAKKSGIKHEEGSIYKTKDAKAIHNKVIGKFASNFRFADTSSLLGFFEFTDKEDEIKRIQTFFS